MTTQDAIDRAARRLMQLRNPHRVLATAMHRLVERHGGPHRGFTEQGRLIEFRDGDNTPRALR